MFVLDDDNVEYLKEEKNETYGNLTKEEHDRAVSFGLQILSNLRSGVASNLRLCTISEFINYAIADDFQQFMFNLDYLESMLYEPTIEMVLNPERLEEYYTTHRKIVEMLHHDLLSNNIKL